MKKAFLFLVAVALVGLVLAANNGMNASGAANSGGTTYRVSLDVAQPQAGQHSILGRPTLSAAFIDRVLSAAHSPAAGTGQTFYESSLQFGIDDVWPLSFFHHESDYGLTGEARTTFSIGNSRCIDQGRGGYAQMLSWTDGIAQWYLLISNLYIKQWGRSTVEAIIPKYAPSSDGNDEQAYITDLVNDAAAYRAGRVLP